tara:strand:- start:3271 stop:3981 length:711 start_codon:yes stop_codon:yes gene_type:complete
MNKKYFLSLFLISFFAVASDNEIYVDQSGSTANIDLEQLGSGNIIGGLNSVAGTLTAFDLDGTSLTLDINQIGSSNKFLGDIYADSYTGFFEFSGSSNLFTIQVDPDNTYGADSSNVNVNVTGGSNTFTLNQGTSALASTLDLDWIINGSNNTITSSINYDLGTNYMDIDGSDNSVTFTGSGYQGGYFYLDHTGGSRTFNITQSSTLDNDWLKIISNGNNGTVCVIQNDGGTSTSC